MSETLLGQIRFVAARSLRRSARQPALLFPSIVFPLILLAINASGFDAATKIPGFPTHSYLDFGLAVCFMQGALFAAITAGTELASDIESGFLNRLQLTPLRRGAILVGQLAGAVAVALISSIVYIVVGFIFGVSIKSGAAGVLVLLALGVVTAIGLSGLGSIMAARTGSSEAVQGLFPLLFVLFFLSSLNLPRPLIEQDWFRTIATWNPFSYLVEGLRSLVITGWDGTALWRGFVTALAISVVSLTGASAALRTRMGRT